jgi:hypothetical protein
LTHKNTHQARIKRQVATCFQLSGKQSGVMVLDYLLLFSMIKTSFTAFHELSDCSARAARALKMLRDYFLINVQDAVCGKQSRAQCRQAGCTDRRLLKLRQVSSNNSEKTVEREREREKSE